MIKLNKLAILLILYIVVIKFHETLNEKNHQDEERDEDDNNDEDETIDQDDLRECYNDNRNPYLLFATKTSYLTVVPEELSIVQPSEGCSAKMLWMVIRHGVRYSVRMNDFYVLYRVRDEIIYNHDSKRNVDLCEKDINNLRNWYFTMGEEQENCIHENGLEESREVAKRFKKKFPELLKPPYVPGKYLMKVTNTTSEKTWESGKAFMEAMFPSNPMVLVYPALKNDLLVQIYTPCINEMLKDVSHRLLKDFYASKTFQCVLESVKRRLNLKKLIPKTLVMMYKICRFDKAWNYGKISPWCGVFTVSELKVLEYFQDYKYSVKSGYGSEATSKKLGCPLVRDMIMRFKDINEGNFDKQSYALFHMAHSTTLNTLFVGLGISKDSEELTPTNYKKQRNRKWRTSLNGPFGANFAAVFYGCENGENRVIMYLNEKPVLIDGCDGVMCSFDVLYNIYKDYIEAGTCDVNRLCETNNYAWLYFLGAIITVVLVIVFRHLLITFLRKTKTTRKFVELFSKEKRHVV